MKRVIVLLLSLLFLISFVQGAVLLQSPVDEYINTASKNLNFTCQSDQAVDSLVLYTDLTGQWQAYDSKVSQTATFFIYNFL